MDALHSRRPCSRTSSAAWKRLLFSSPSPSTSSAPDSDLHENDVLWNHLDLPRPAIDNDNDDDDEGEVRQGASSSSSSSSLRTIPIAPTKKAEAKVEVMARSAPINIPIVRGRGRHRRELDLEEEKEEEEEYDEEENGQWLPPHEIVARTWEKRNMTCYSVLEGAGRTLKGRDLHRVRDAVLQQTGFLD